MEKTIWITRNKHGQWYKFDIHCPIYCDGIWLLNPMRTNYSPGDVDGLRTQYGEWIDKDQLRRDFLSKYAVSGTIPEMIRHVCCFQVEEKEENVEKKEVIEEKEKKDPWRQEQFNQKIVETIGAIDEVLVILNAIAERFCPFAPSDYSSKGSILNDLKEAMAKLYGYIYLLRIDPAYRMPIHWGMSRPKREKQK